MRSSAEIRVLFRAPAGPRRGFGHLVRCRSFARALGVQPVVALRGSRQVHRAALALGCDVVKGSASGLLRNLSPDVLIVDDPVTRDAQRWISAARRAGCFVASVHDLGIGCLDGDLVIDGSVTRNARARRGVTLSGPRFAVLDPATNDIRTRRDPHTVLVTLGGGPRAAFAAGIAEAIVAGHPRARVRVAGGFMAGTPTASSRVTFLGPVSTLRAEMARASVAVVGGGLSLYEACACGTPAVGVPVVDAQRPTVAAFIARGAAKGIARGPILPRSVAAECLALLNDRTLRRRLTRASRRLVDGRGARRAAAVLTRLTQKRRTR